MTPAGFEHTFPKSEQQQTRESDHASTGIGSKESMASVDKKNQLDVTFVFFISLLIVAQHVSGNHVPIIKT